jgi:hypothetical protein
MTNTLVKIVLIFAASFASSLSFAKNENSRVVQGISGEYFQAKLGIGTATEIQVEAGLILTEDQLKHFMEGDKNPLPVETTKSLIRWQDPTHIVEEANSRELIFVDGLMIKKLLKRTVKSKDVFNLFYVSVLIYLFSVFAIWFFHKKYKSWNIIFHICVGPVILLASLITAIVNAKEAQAYFSIIFLWLSIFFFAKASLVTETTRVAKVRIRYFILCGVCFAIMSSISMFFLL